MNLALWMNRKYYIVTYLDGGPVHYNGHAFTSDINKTHYYDSYNEAQSASNSLGKSTVRYIHKVTTQKEF